MPHILNLNYKSKPNHIEAIDESQIFAKPNHIEAYKNMPHQNNQLELMTEFHPFIFLSLSVLGVKIYLNQHLYS